MSGGPVNGVPWSASASILGGGAIASAMARGTDPDSYNGIIVPTVLQIANDAIKYWTSLTCLYDRYWTAEPGRVTLPVCMFNVKKITPTRTVEVSKKRVILYEPQQDKRMPSSDKADPMRQGVMQTIVDNAVKQPTTYTMDVIVPFQPIGRYVAEGVKTISDVVVGVSDLLGGSTPGGFTDWWEGVLSSVFSLLKVANTAAEIAGRFPGADGSSYINMNSLEAMADSCRTLCMKMWTGYDYKYVMITNMTYDKNPLEDNVFRASLSLQEMPVLAVSRSSDPKPAAISRDWRVTAISAVQGALVSPLLALTGVKTAAGSSESWTGMIKNVLGG